MSPEAREQQLTALAMDLVEQRLRDGTASSQETTHFLKLASTKANLEREKLRYETELIKSKKESLDSARRSDDMFEEAIKAMRGYQGISDETEEY
jgi:hypothetical protein